MRFALTFALLALAITTAQAGKKFAIPRFADETRSSGLNSKYVGEWLHIVGGGVATFDCNGDGFPEVYVAGGDNPTKLYVNRSKRGGALKFSEEKSGAEMTAVTGAYPIDIDSDGNTDLVVLRAGASKVFRGLGECKFEDATAAWNIDGGNAWTTAFSATWENGMKWPTLAFGSYVAIEHQNDPWGHCTDNWLLRPKQAGGGYEPRVPLKPSYCALSMLFTDWNRSGTPSLRVANDREYYEGGQEQMWKVPPGAAPSLYTAADGWKFQRFWGMGIASQDIKGTGFPAMMITSMGDQRLQFLSGDASHPTFSDASFSMGISAHRPFAGGDERPSTGWHAQFEDMNNDGRYDLFVAKGNIDRMADFAQRDPSNLLLQKPDGNFEESAEQAHMLNFDEGRGASLDDFNLDGKLDVLIVNRDANLRLFRNVSTHLGHWVDVSLAQDGANRNAIGSWIEVEEADRKIMRREVQIGGGHASGHLAAWHFGLGALKSTRVRVLWPGGTQSEWLPVAADNRYEIDRAQGLRRAP